MKMFIKVLKCSDKSLWYYNKIGAIFRVADIFKKTYSVYYGIGECQINNNDCIISKINKDKL